MNRKILGLLASLALVAGCEVAKTTTYVGPTAQCRTAGGACTQNAECCSYGCTGGVCVPGDHVGTVCRTTNDCGYPDLASFTQMTCKSGACTATTATTCRDDADVCTTSSQCCGHHCSATVAGVCVPNKIPVITVNGAFQTVPRGQPWSMANSATAVDPDGLAETASLVWGWTFSPAPPTLLTPSNTVANPTFNPGSTPADYVVTLTVTDTWGASASATFTLHVVNTPPVVTPAALTAPWDRNNGTLNVQMSANDANGDSMSCTWTVCRAGGAPCLTAPAGTTGLVAVAPPSVPNVIAAFPAPLAGTDEGPWNATLTCTDGFGGIGVGTTTVTVNNSPPTVSVPPTSTFNLGHPNATTMPVAHISATASDPNLDVIDSWTWTIAPPAGKSSAVGSSLVVTNTGVGSLSSSSVASFTPDVTGDYTLTVKACDPTVSSPSNYFPTRQGCTTKTIVATVYPYIRPIIASPGTVLDAAWRKVAGNERLVAVGTDTASANQLWIVNPAVDPAATADASVAIGAAPVGLSLSSDGLTALVGEAAGHWQTVAVGSTPGAATLQTAPLTITSVVHFGSSSGYALGTGGASPIYNLNLSTGASSPMACKNSPCTIAGNKGAGNGTALWALDTGTSTLRAYSALGNQLNQDAAQPAPAAATNVWRSSDPNYLFMDGTNGIVFAATLGTTGSSLPAGATHADSSNTMGSLVGLAATGGTVTPFGSSFTAGTAIPLPHWGLAGVDRTVSSQRVFVSADGTKAHVVVQAAGTADLGLYSCTLPCPLF